MALFIYVLLTALIGVLEGRRRLARQPVDALTFFNAAYLLLFALIPVNVLCLGEDVVRQKYAYETYGEGNVSTALSLSFCYILFCLGYWLKSSSVPRPGSATGCISLADSARVAKILFVVGAVLTAVYIAQVGGVTEAISSAEDVRSGELVIESKYIGYRHLSQFSADAFVLFSVVLLGKWFKKIRVTIADWVFLALALIFFVYYGLTTAGRRPFIYPVLLCILVYLSLGGRVKKTALAVLALVFVLAGLGTLLGPVILSGNLAAAFDLADLNQGNWPALFALAYDNATQGLADSYVHFVAAQKATLWQFGFLTDIVNLPRDFFPSRLLGFERSRNMLGETSEFILGHPLDEGASGEEALGLHGYMLVNFGYAGMLASFFALGLIYKWIHVRFKPTAPGDAVRWLIYWWLVLGFFVYFREGILLFVFKQQLTWWLAIGLLVFFESKRRTRRGEAIFVSGAVMKT